MPPASASVRSRALSRALLRITSRLRDWLTVLAIAFRARRWRLASRICFSSSLLSVISLINSTTCKILPLLSSIGVVKIKLNMNNNESIIKAGVYKIGNEYKWITFSRSGYCKTLKTALKKAGLKEPYCLG